ncbi:MAG: N-formylglutamate amidohydrolase [Paracoccaceae bacterium]
MIKIYDTNFKLPYKFKAIFNSPHSGSVYTKEFLKSTNLKIYDLRTSEDAFVGELFYPTKFFNCLLMEAIFPRTFVDLNRSHLELDPYLISGDFSFDKTARNMAGLGVIPRVSGNGKQIYSKTIIAQDALKRLERYYFPYHKFLTNLLLESKKRLGYAVLFDCHSMPSKLNLETNNLKKTNNTDIILGDSNGTSCSPILTDKVKSIFENYNFFVTKNHPFSGGYITKKYGDPANDIHVIQIEINKKLYMDENDIKKNKYFESFKRKLTFIIEELSTLNTFRGDKDIAAV